MKKILTIVVALLLLTVSLIGCGTEKVSGKYASGKHQVEIVVQDYGTITLELDADVAPITVANFCKLANEKFYDGVTFHRIIDGFMIQGGDPDGDGIGGSAETIKGEFAANGVENSITHVRGVISMARTTDPNSASSQFFIVHEDSTHLDGQYAAFGKVIEGDALIDQIANVQTGNYGWYMQDVPMDPVVIESLEIIAE